jgi:hypothetical protein
MYAIDLEVGLNLLQEGVNCTGKGPADYRRNKRRYHEDMRRSNKYAEDILNRTSAPGDEFCRHRPPNPSVDNLSSSEDEITPKRAKMNANKRVGRRRSETSKNFRKILNSASVASFTVVDVDVQSTKNEATVVIKKNEEDIEVYVRKSLFCQVCFPTYEGKNTINTCLHIVWVLMNVFFVSKSSSLLAQINLTDNELTNILKKQKPGGSSSSNNGNNKQPPPSPSPSASGSCTIQLSEAEQLAIFEAHNDNSSEQEWFVDKLIARKSASCCARDSNATMPAGKIYVFVKGLYIPKNQTFATERIYYFCALPKCLSKKPYHSNIIVPPQVVKVAGSTNLLAADITSIRSHGINIIQV